MPISIYTWTLQGLGNHNQHSKEWLFPLTRGHCKRRQPEPTQERMAISTYPWTLQEKGMTRPLCRTHTAVAGTMCHTGVSLVIIPVGSSPLCCASEWKESPASEWKASDSDPKSFSCAYAHALTPYSRLQSHLYQGPHSIGVPDCPFLTLLCAR